MSSRAMNQSQQIDLLAGMDRLEHWRLEAPETRAFEVSRWMDSDGDPVWNVNWADGSQEPVNVVKDRSLLRAVRIILGVHEGGVPVE